MRTLLKILNGIFVTLGIVFLILIIIAVYFFVADPFEIKPLLKMMKLPAITSEASSPATDKNPLLTAEQEKVLESFGVDSLGGYKFGTLFNGTNEWAASAFEWIKNHTPWGEKTAENDDTIFMYDVQVNPQYLSEEGLANLNQLESGVSIGDESHIHIIKTGI